MIYLVHAHATVPGYWIVESEPGDEATSEKKIHKLKVDTFCSINIHSFSEQQKLILHASNIVATDKNGDYYIFTNQSRRLCSVSSFCVNFCLILYK